jgi:hypothetical protein
MILIATTIPHYFIICSSHSILYNIIVFISTSCSVAWHAYPTLELGIVDHVLALIWALADIYYVDRRYRRRSVILNGVICGLNVCSYCAPLIFPITYDAAHSAWHLCSVVKALYMTSLKPRLTARSRASLPH